MNDIYEVENNFKIGKGLSIGDLVFHATVPQIGLGLITRESERHSGYWIIKWCDKRYDGVGELGIHEDFITKVN